MLPFMKQFSPCHIPKKMSQAHLVASRASTSLNSSTWRLSWVHHWVVQHHCLLKPWPLGVRWFTRCTSGFFFQSSYYVQWPASLRSARSAPLVHWYRKWSSSENGKIHNTRPMERPNGRREMGFSGRFLEGKRVARRRREMAALWIEYLAASKYCKL